jgi:AraC family transcriptional activator of pobA
MNNKNEYIHFNKVGDLYDTLGMSIEQNAEFTIHNLLDIHDKIPYKSPVFRANYYSFVFIKRGEGNYTIDNQNFEYASQTIYFTNPGHLKAFEFYKLEEGFLITLSKSFLKNNVHKDIFNTFSFLLAETVPPQVLSSDDFKVFEDIYQQILNEYQHNSTYKYEVIGNLFVVFLFKLKEQFWYDYQPMQESNRGSQIVKKFKQLLEKNSVTLTTAKESKTFRVKNYAEAQHLSTSYFNQVIKSKTGKSASAWIAEKMIIDAKVLLKHTRVSVKEISYRLGYSETAHFSHFFKKQTGCTPSAYRENLKP